jgi:hypothetical protein
MARTDEGSSTVRVLGVLVTIAGVILAVAGVVVYVIVSMTLSDQRITVSDDASHFGGQRISQPWQAYAQANVIDKHAQKISGGKTYAELPQDDPNRDTVMTASFLQASLFTSVVAFGVAAMAFGIGIVLVLVGWALWVVGRGSRVDHERGDPAADQADDRPEAPEDADGEEISAGA